MVILCGCGAKKPETKKDLPTSKTSDVHARVHCGPVEFSRIADQDGKRGLVWKVACQDALVTLDGDAQSGTLSTVKGTIYKEGIESALITGETGEAEKGTDRLILHGNVKIHDLRQGTVVNCDDLVWNAKEGLVKLKGDVRLNSQGLKFESTDELWATPDLKMVGTPDQFGGKK